jgi:hypothetical protein
MKITEALKKSNVIRRASVPQDIFEVKGNMVVLQGDESLDPIALSADQLNANDWQFRIEKWVGSKEKKVST